MIGPMNHTDPIKEIYAQFGALNLSNNIRSVRKIKTGKKLEIN